MRGRNAHRFRKGDNFATGDFGDFCRFVARCRRLGRRRSKVGAVMVVVVVAAMAHRLLLSVATARALVAAVGRRAISAAVGASR